MIRTTDLATFLRTFNVMNNGEIDFFLGSGASVKAGIPTGSGLVWYFKREIFCSETGTSIDKFKDLQSEQTQKSLQEYFDTSGTYPRLYDPCEYSYYFELCYNTNVARERFIQEIVRDISPSIGHLCLANMIISAKVQCVWTTNFDELVEAGIKTLMPSYGVNVYSDANKSSLEFSGHDSFSSIYKLHGDYRYDQIRNTSLELRSLELSMNHQLETKLKGKGLIVIGYSGCDDSIMNTLEKNIIDTEFLKYGLTWMVPTGVDPSDRVKRLMESACSRNGLSSLVEIEDFDEFLYACYQAQGTKNGIIENRWQDYPKRKRKFVFSLPHIESFIKINTFVSNQFPECKTFDTDIVSWADLRSVVAGSSEIVAALFSNRIYCFGDDKSIQSIFGRHICSEVIVEGIPEKILNRSNSVYTGMLYELIGKVLVKDKGLSVCGKNKYFDKGTGRIQDRIYSVYDGMEIALSFFNDNFYLSVVPTVYISRIDGQIVDKEEKQMATNKIMSMIYNKQYNDKLIYWYKLFWNSKLLKIIFEYKGFELIFLPMYLSSGNGGVNPKSDWPMVSSFQYLEPEMSFSVTDDSCKGINQLKGITKYAPIDYSYSNEKAMRMAIRIAIISPKQALSKVINHLRSLSKKSTPKNANDGFLPSYNGFENIYRRGIEVPIESDSMMCALYDEFEALKMNTKEFVQLIKSKIDHFSINCTDIDLVVIYIPTSFVNFRESQIPDDDFNLHDAIKLYATDKGIKLQFIEEKSINAFDPCRVMWGLSTSIYAKTSGVLWQPATLNMDTAFVGISYAQSKTKGICIGCSQLFDSTGTGIRLILRKINNPQFFDHNPFMKCDEARTTMSTLRYQYYKCNPTAKLNRIVIHKTTYFTPEEIKGFTQAFEGIEDIELLQIQEITPWRAIRYMDDSLKGPHNFAIKRGTVISLSSDSFLIWTHGCVIHDELLGKYNYYKGGRGIPAPLLVRRFYGKASGDTVVNEILMLTKMNWNSGDSLYKILPVTLDFAKTLSRMAKQNEAIYDKAYDFRYFM